MFMRFLILYFLGFLLFSNAQDDLSVKNYDNLDEQKAFNVVKNIFNNEKLDYIIDTSWDKVHIMKRYTSGFLDFNVKVDNFILEIVSQEDVNLTNLKLSIYTQMEDKQIKENKNEFIYKLFWNRLEFGLGYTKEWIDCFNWSGLSIYYTHPLCTIKKEYLKQ